MVVLPSHSLWVGGKQKRLTGPGPPASGAQLVASMVGAPSLKTPLPPSVTIGSPPLSALLMRDGPASVAESPIS